MDQCQLFEEHESDPKIAQGNTSDPQVYFEVDAFLGDARRIYDSISKVLWKHYVGNSQGRWRSIRKLVESEAALATIPAEFPQPLKQSWDVFGIKLTDYRDFVMHIAPLAGEGATWMNRYDGRWALRSGSPPIPRPRAGRSITTSRRWGRCAEVLPRFGHAPDRIMRATNGTAGRRSTHRKSIAPQIFAERTA